MKANVKGYLLVLIVAVTLTAYDIVCRQECKCNITSLLPSTPVHQPSQMCWTQGH